MCSSVDPKGFLRACLSITILCPRVTVGKFVFPVMTHLLGTKGNSSCFQLTLIHNDARNYAL